MAYFFKLPPITDLTIGQQAALNEPSAVAISGGPGTGKSVVSLWRHIRNHGLGSINSLLLTYTKTLETYLAASAKSENENAGNAVDRTYWWITHNATEYDEIIVDEAQDVKLEKYEIIKRYSESVSYGADPHQSIFLSPDELARLMAGLPLLFPNNQKYVLDENFRNTHEVIQFVRALFPNRLINGSNIRGIKPIQLISNNNSQKQNKAIIDIINEFKSDTHNIAIIVPLTNHVDAYYNLVQQAGIHCSRFTNTDGELATIENVHITTFKSAKGTEFDTVIIPDFENMQTNIAQLRVVNESDYYVAITRAKRNLYLISSSPLSFLELSQQQKDTYQKEIL